MDKNMPHAEIIRFTKHFQALHALLKTTRLKKQKTSRTLDKLPWYIMVGSKNAGKTTMLAHSDLQFILEKKIQDKHIANNNNYDAWVTKKAIVIDAPGKLFQTKNPLWYLCLRLIKKYCPTRTPNGIIVVLDIQDLVQFEKRKNVCDYLSEKIVSIQKIFRADIPFFFIFNKCDAITGFREFFGSLSRDERWQPWGFPLPEKTFSTKGLNIGFNKLMRQLNEQLIWKLEHENNLDKRTLITAFPYAMQKNRSALIKLFKHILPKIEQPICLEGIFFSAASTQSPTTNHNAKPNPNAGQFLMNVAQPNNRAFFIHDLLEHYICNTKPPRTQIVTPMLRASTLWLTLSTAIAVLLLCSVVWIKNFSQQAQQINRIQEVTTIYKLLNTQQSNNAPTMQTQLRLLDTVESILHTFEKQQTTHFAFLDPNQAGRHLKDKALQLYLQTASKILLPILTQDLSATLSNSQTAPKLLYGSLASYLMLTNSEHYNPNYILATVQRIWTQSSYTPDTQHALLQHFRLFLSYYKPGSISPNIQLIQAARNSLKNLDEPKLAYLVLENMPDNYPLLALNLQSSKSAAALITIDEQSYIPALYTKARFDIVMQSLTMQAAQETIQGNWVIGEPTASSDTSAENLKHTLSDMYIKQYGATWMHFLQHTHITQARDFKTLQTIITSLSDTNSPLDQLITLVKNNIPDAVSLTDNEFSNIPQTYPLYAKLQKYLTPLFSGDQSDASKQAFDMATYRMRNPREENPIATLMLQSRNYPDPFSKWLYYIGQTSWKLILEQAQSYIDQQWKSSIVPQYTTQIVNHYPFQSNATKQASLESFNYFFAPSGVLDDFIATYLKPFLDTSQKPWKLKSIDGYSLNLSNTTLRQLERVYDIQNAYFDKRSQRLQVPFSLQPISMEDNVRQLTIALGSQQENYANEEPFQKRDFLWPDDADSNTLNVTFTNKSGETITIQNSGPWAWLQLLSQSTQITNGHTEITFDKDGYAAKLQYTSPRKQNPFTLTLFQDFKLPTQLGN